MLSLPVSLLGLIWPGERFVVGLSVSKAIRNALLCTPLRSPAVLSMDAANVCLANGVVGDIRLPTAGSEEIAAAFKMAVHDAASLLGRCFCPLRLRWSVSRYDPEFYALGTQSTQLLVEILTTALERSARPSLSLEYLEFGDIGVHHGSKNEVELLLFLSNHTRVRSLEVCVGLPTLRSVYGDVFHGLLPKLHLHSLNINFSDRRLTGRFKGFLCLTEGAGIKELSVRNIWSIDNISLVLEGTGDCMLHTLRVEKVGGIPSEPFSNSRRKMTDDVLRPVAGRFFPVLHSLSLRDARLPLSDCVGTLTKVLERMPLLATLDLSGNFVRAAPGGRELLRTLAEIPRLETLDLSHTTRFEWVDDSCCLGVDVGLAAALPEDLASSRHLRLLRFHGRRHGPVADSFPVRGGRCRVLADPQVEAEGGRDTGAEVEMWDGI